MDNLLDNYLFEALTKATDTTYLYVTDMKNDMSRWSKGTVDFFGLESEYINNSKDMWLEHIHPDDRQLFLDDISAIYSGESDYHNCQYRAKNKYGKYIWVECRGSIIYDDEGEPYILAGLITRIDHQSKYDSLTHLLTGYELIRSQLCSFGSLMIIGIDNFRNINSQHGLSYGNKVLLHLTDLLTSHAGQATVYRFRGDEFAIYSKINSAYDMQSIYLKLLDECKRGDSKNDIQGYRISAGIVNITEECHDTTDVLGHAELSLAHAKEEATSGFCIFSAEIEQKHIRRTMISDALCKSIDNNFEGFNLVFQPIIDNT